jgi:hypothetical protein
MQIADEVDGLAVVARKQEVGPVDPLLRPGQLLAAAKPVGAEVEAIVR